MILIAFRPFLNISQPLLLQAIASLAALELDIKSVNLISSSHRATQIFLSEATTLGIRVPKMLELSHRLVTTQVNLMLRNLPPTLSSPFHWK